MSTMEDLTIAQMLAQAANGPHPPPPLPPPADPGAGDASAGAMDSSQHQASHSGNADIDADVEFASEVRHATLTNTEPIEVLAQRAREAVPGQVGDKARSLFGTTWLLHNYELAEGFNIPRQDLYDQYKAFAESHNVTPVNQSVFGKIVRYMWPDLKTRRLGIRGQSKYHYCGIRLKGAPYSPQLLEMQNPFTALMLSGIANGNMSVNPLFGQNESLAHIPLPEFPAISEAFVPLGATLAHVQQFVAGYKMHCQQILDALQTMQFQNIEVLLRTFWTTLPEDSRRLVNSPESIELVWRCDSILYDTIMNVLLPSPLHQLPMLVTQALRHFARQLESWILTSMEGYFPMLVARKVEVAKVFAQQLKRHTSLNFLAQAAAQVLESADNMHAMFIEWSKLDFEGIKDQAAWVTECRKVDVMQVAEMEVKNLLSSSSKLEQWTVWLDSVIARFLDDKLDPVKYVQQARQFLMKWTFYGALCMRDLTLRSMATYGSFHVARLFVDEYILFVVEQRIANAQTANVLNGSILPPPPATQAPQPLGMPPTQQEVTDLLMGSMDMSSFAPSMNSSDAAVPVPVNHSDAPSSLG